MYVSSSMIRPHVSSYSSNYRRKKNISDSHRNLIFIPFSNLFFRIFVFVFFLHLGQPNVGRMISRSFTQTRVFVFKLFGTQSLSWALGKREETRPQKPHTSTMRLDGKTTWKSTKNTNTKRTNVTRAKRALFFNCYYMRNMLLHVDAQLRPRFFYHWT